MTVLEEFFITSEEYKSPWELARAVRELERDAMGNGLRNLGKGRQ